LPHASDEPRLFRYSRPPIDPEGRDSLATLSRWIEPRSEVLDLGASTGALGRYLADRGCEVDGVELDPAAARMARSSYRSLIEADLETADLEELFEGHRYDAVVCADVLEHLRNPGRILEQARRLLKPNGALLVSVPNVGYAGVLLELLAGDFTYRPLGILDETHLRFYTRPSLLQLLTNHGFHPDKIEPVTLSLNESEFGNRMVDRFPPRVVKSVLEQPDALVYQFVVHAKLEPGPSEWLLPAPRPLACFAAQIFWRSGTAPYEEANSSTANAPLDTEVHELRFPLPASVDDGTSFRFDPSDRAGFIYLHSILEQDESGRRRWSWQAGDGPAPVHPRHQLIAIPGGPVSTFVSLGEDPSFELVVPKSIRRLGAGALLIRISLMPTADALAVTQGLAEANARLAEVTSQSAEAKRRLEQAGPQNVRVEQLADLEARMVERNDRKHDSLLATFQTAVGSLGSQVQAVQSAVESLAARHPEIQARLARVEQLLAEGRSTWRAELSKSFARMRERARRTIAAILPRRVKVYIRKQRLKRRSQLISDTGLFDSLYYLAQNPDVAASGMPPIQHYLLFGAAEGRDPHEMFDTSYYLDQNPDVAISGIDPLLHFHLYGLPEGRRPHPSFSANQYRLATLSRSRDPAQGESSSHTPRRQHSQQPPQRFETRLIGGVAQSDRVPRDIVATTLVVSHVLPFPPRAGNEYRIHRLAKWLQSIGHEVLLVVSPLPAETLDRAEIVRAAGQYPNLIVCERDGLVSFQSQRPEVHTILSALSGQRPQSFARKNVPPESGLTARIADLEQIFCPDHLADLLCRLANASPPNVALSNYVFMSRFLPMLSSRIFRVVDTHDVFSTKKSKVVRYGVADSLDISGEEEAALLKRADLIIAIQPNDAQELIALSPGRTVVTAGVDFEFVKELPPPPAEPLVLYVASNNTLNVKGITDFLAIAWPLVLREVPDARMLIVGAVCEAVADGIVGVDRLGRVEDLKDVYARAKVVVNLSVAGTGLKIKTIEALSHLRPIVVWPSGVDGLSLEAQRYCAVAQDWYDFARLVVRQLKSDQALELIAHRDEIEREFSPEIVYAALRAQIETRLRSESSTEGRRE
jgi:2-polyprenyl-3-methyl-5-hydroxy-6-metoxy-1,4-benzoquinol methylase